MAQINWTKQALQDLEAIGDYIARDTPEIQKLPKFLSIVYLMP